MSGVGKSLTRKLGPLPAWAWLGLFAVVMVVLRTVRRPAASSPAGQVAPSEGPSVPVILAPLQTHTEVTTLPAATPAAPLAYPSTLKKKEVHAFDSLVSWWQAGGGGQPPTPVEVRSRNLPIYSQQAAYYQAHPYTSGAGSTGTQPSSVVDDYHVDVYSPVEDSYA